jgi:hypothetical protein
MARLFPVILFGISDAFACRAPSLCAHDKNKVAGKKIQADSAASIREGMDGLNSSNAMFWVALIVAAA